MKRFVDIREAETGWRFAWWCTCIDRFEEFQGEQAWDTFAEFETVYDGAQIERYRGLAPNWAFQEPEDD